MFYELESKYLLREIILGWLREDRSEQFGMIQDDFELFSGMLVVPVIIVVQVL